MEDERKWVFLVCLILLNCNRSKGFNDDGLFIVICSTLESDMHVLVCFHKNHNYTHIHISDSLEL